MPKQVDHDARRAQIAAALCRVIVRAGVEGASVRAVAEEAGWSAGALRHYFRTQEELLRFGVELQLRRIPERLRAIVEREPAEHEPAQDGRAILLLEQLLPLDEERIAEARVWLAVMARAQVDPALDEIRRQAWIGEAYIVRGVVCELLGRPWPERLDTVLEPTAEAEAEALRVFVDGLTLLGVNHPEALPAGRIRTLLTTYVDGLADRLRNGPAKVRR
ncbi:MAG: TetR family transcriptional regulator [Austwickia sp.]|nr:TetR family transcriptional regulator [Actinomycetota bacterium]MCB1253668.1 TetR/AcrR family transcriptional regulator [Austwickia sp.]MCO5309930.1 TetR family transcriptional regulator [Austwickia sp.]